jgi:hypothetical protein
MPDAHDPSDRLARLERILAQRPAAETSNEPVTDAVQLNMRSLPTDRIRQLTSELQRRSHVESDTIDALEMRLLLNDYSTAVAHLRAIARITASRLATVAEPIRRAGRWVERMHEKQERAQNDAPTEPRVR